VDQELFAGTAPQNPALQTGKAGPCNATLPSNEDQKDGFSG